MIPSKIIIHHSLTWDSKTVSWQAIRRYHVDTQGWHDIGYHFGIELVNDHYEIMLGRFWNIPGAHTMGQNDESIGICVVGNFDEEQPKPEQIELLTQLVRTLQETFSIPSSAIFGHFEFAKKSCPGKYLQPVVYALRGNK